MLIAHLIEAVRRTPDKLAAADPTRSLSYRQLATFARVIRRVIRRETACPRVGLMLPASVGGLGTMLGALWAGRTIVPLNFLLQPRELAAVVADAGIDLIISTEYFKAILEQIPVRALYLEQMKLKRAFVLEQFRFRPPLPRVDEDDLAAIVYTSGTTGVPKGVCLSHGNFASNCDAVISQFRIDANENLLGVLPPFHVFGLTVLQFLPIHLGATVTYLPRFSPQAAYKLICEAGITMLLAVPSMYGAVARLKSIDQEKFGRIKIAASGGEPLPRTTYHLFQEKTGVRLIEGYGLTETSPVLAADVPWEHHVGTVGRLLPGVEVQLRDAQGGVLAHDQEGELFVRGPGIMKGYYNKPEETARAIDADGWFRTGDIVRIDETGHITITGRAKDLIIVGGDNVYPREVESVLEEHPAVAEAAVIGQPDASRGEVVVAFVKLKDGAEVSGADLRAYCREQLAGYKVPREVIIREDMPRGPTGKILKRELKSLLPA